MSSRHSCLGPKCLGLFPMYRGRGCCLLWPVCSIGKTLLAFALLHFVLQGETCVLFQVSLDFLLLHSSPLWWKGHLFLVLVLGDLVYFTQIQHFWDFLLFLGFSSMFLKSVSIWLLFDVLVENITYWHPVMLD